MTLPKRVPLCLLPTPCHRLPRASDHLGIELWVKRDDLTGFAGGGNKGRKLEYLAPQVSASGCDTVVTCGASQSNFVRQLGALCLGLGRRLIAVTMELPYEGTIGRPMGSPPSSGGNLPLDRLFGVELRTIPDGPWEELVDAARLVAVEERAKGHNVLEIPLGGSSPLGAFAFVQAASELEQHFDHVVVATSSGSTHAGLAYALGESVVGVACDPEEDLRDDVTHLVEGIGGLRGEPRVPAIRLRYEWVGPGYGVPSAKGEAARLALARQEGLILDPIYTAKAFAGLTEMAQSGEVGGRVLFWHTGGLPTACAPEGWAPDRPQ